MAEASEAKKYSTSLSSNGENSEVESERESTGTSRPCSLCSIKTIIVNKGIELGDQNHDG